MCSQALQERTQFSDTDKLSRWRRLRPDTVHTKSLPVNGIHCERSQDMLTIQCTGNVLRRYTQTQTYTDTHRHTVTDTTVFQRRHWTNTAANWQKLTVVNATTHNSVKRVRTLSAEKCSQSHRHDDLLNEPFAPLLNVSKNSIISIVQFSGK